MSMNFAREQSLLRQKLQAKASPERAASRGAPFAGAVTFLGADDADVAAAADALAAAWPQMGRAQMTAFVRTLWSSKVHEMRDIGSRLLALRAELLEPADLPLVETFLGGAAEAAVLDRLARDVLGAMTARAKKLWKDLKRHAGAADASARRRAVLAAGRPLAADVEAFPRFVELVEPLLAAADAELLAALDATLAHAAATHRDAVFAFASRHGRTVALPAPAPAAPTPAPAAVAAPTKKPVAAKPSAAKAPGKPAVVVPPKAPAKKPASKPVAKKPVSKPAAKKPGARKPEARGKAAAAPRKAAAKAR